MDAFYNTSFGAYLGFSSVKFDERPYLPYEMNKIIISNMSLLKRKFQIYYQVTIDGGNGDPSVIGDNVPIEVGTKNIKSVKIGAGCIVAVDVPDNATVVMDRPRIILYKEY